MELHEIRLMIINGEGAKIRSILLTEDQINLLLFINLKGEYASANLAKVKKISIQNASAKLSTLYKKGYLDRLTVSSESGGIEHLYRVKVEL